MELLLDTHVLLWFLQNNAKLPIHVRHIIEDGNNNVAVSIASYWEIAIKQKQSKGDMPWTAGVPALEHLALASQP
jgi:PIN domain nuclease of toxin-antitoxin system